MIEPEWASKMKSNQFRFQTVFHRVDGTLHENKIAFWSKADHPRMRAFSYAWTLGSRDKDGGHTIRSAVAKNSMLHAYFMAVCFIEPSIIAD